MTSHAVLKARRGRVRANGLRRLGKRYGNEATTSGAGGLQLSSLMIGESGEALRVTFNGPEKGAVA
jgi:hypothetical protein